MSIKPSKILEMPDTLFAGIDRQCTFKTMGEIPGQWYVFGPHVGSIPHQSEAVALERGRHGLDPHEGLSP